MESAASLLGGGIDLFNKKKLSESEGGALLQNYQK